MSLAIPLANTGRNPLNPAEMATESKADTTTEPGLHAAGTAQLQRDSSTYPSASERQYVPNLIEIRAVF
jgi:hypothetical protein